MKLIVEGGEPLIGNIKVSGAKNSSLKILAASVLSNEEIIIENVPNIENVTSDIEIIKVLGGKVEWVSTNKLAVDCSGISSFVVPYELGSRNRTVALLVGPLLYRFGKAVIPKPGGCRIGYRPLNIWINTWKELGFEVLEDDKLINVSAKKPTNADITFKTNTVMGTENAILSSVFILGETTINNAACEPEVDDLINFLNAISANVKRVEERKIVVNGSQTFFGTKYKVMPDRNEVVTFAIAALMTYGDIKIEGAVPYDLLPFIRKLEAMGVSFEFKDSTLRIWRTKGQTLKPVNVETAAAPGFMTDWQPLITLLLTQALGDSLVHDTIYTDRFSYTKELNRMGAKITLVKPSEVGLKSVISDDMYDLESLGEPLTVAKIEGPTPLKREKLEVPDLRAGATLVIAALAAEGKSEIYGIENIERGYENFEDKLKSLGAKISKV